MSEAVPVRAAGSWNYDSFREYAKRVVGRDFNWHEHALCRQLGPDCWPVFHSDGGDQWRTEAGKKITAHTAQTEAVQKFCVICPVQWECARWGVEMEEPLGIYGMTSRDRAWLTRLPDNRGIAIIDTSRRKDVAVSVAVARARGRTV